MQHIRLTAPQSSAWIGEHLLDSSQDVDHSISDIFAKSYPEHTFTERIFGSLTNLRSERTWDGWWDTTDSTQKLGYYRSRDVPIDETVHYSGKQSELEPRLQISWSISIDEILDAIEIPAHEPPQLFKQMNIPDPSPRSTVQTYLKDASDVGGCDRDENARTTLPTPRDTPPAHEQKGPQALAEPSWLCWQNYQKFSLRACHNHPCAVATEMGSAGV